MAPAALDGDATTDDDDGGGSVAEMEQDAGGTRGGADVNGDWKLLPVGCATKDVAATDDIMPGKKEVACIVMTLPPHPCVVHSTSPRGPL